MERASSPSDYPVPEADPHIYSLPPIPNFEFPQATIEDDIPSSPVTNHYSSGESMTLIQWPSSRVNPPIFPSITDTNHYQRKRKKKNSLPVLFKPFVSIQSLDTTVYVLRTLFNEKEKTVTPEISQKLTELMKEDAIVLNL